VNFLSNLENKRKSFKIFLGIDLIGIFGIIDFLTGYELAFSVFYTIPILLTTWLLGRLYGILASITSTIVWFGADIAAGNLYLSTLIPLWNTIIRFSFFVMITLLLSALKSSMEREKELARIDFLTGAFNSRYFFDMAKIELERAQRYKHCFTLAYVDLDNFKSVNDRYGHTIGDKVLCSLVRYAKNNLRKIDVIARFGGDEFAVLFPETSQDSARSALTKFQTGFSEEMKQRNWNITFSAGVLTCNIPPPSTNELIRMADELMYSIKRGSKNAINYSIYEG
jgi:diguanylate cyclase (GGDEF)-like protein